MVSFSNDVGLLDPSVDLVLGVSSAISVGDGEWSDMVVVGGAQYVGCQDSKKDLETRRLRWLLVVS